MSFYFILLYQFISAPESRGRWESEREKQRMVTFVMWVHVAELHLHQALACEVSAKASRLLLGWSWRYGDGSVRWTGMLNLCECVYMSVCICVGEYSFFKSCPPAQEFVNIVASCCLVGPPVRQTDGGFPLQSSNSSF